MRASLLTPAIASLAIVFSTPGWSNEPSKIITIENGDLIDDGKPLNRIDFSKLIADNPPARRETELSERLQMPSMVLSATGGALVGWPLGIALGGGKPNWTMALIGAGLAGLGLHLANVSDKHLKSAADIFNNETMPPVTSYWKSTLALTAFPMALGFSYYRF